MKISFFLLGIAGLLLVTFAPSLRAQLLGLALIIIGVGGMTKP